MDHESRCSRLSVSASTADTVVWLRKVTKCIGPGFHPDTPASDYIQYKDDNPAFTSAEAEQFDDDMNRCFELLEAAGRNPYDIAIKVQRRLLGMPRSS